MEGFHAGRETASSLYDFGAAGTERPAQWCAVASRARQIGGDLIDNGFCVSSCLCLCMHSSGTLQCADCAHRPRSVCGLQPLPNTHTCFSVFMYIGATGLI